MSEKNTFFFFVGISILFHLVASYFNTGFHHPDEHFQIIEFANYKLGLVDSKTLAWEFDAHIRPSLQPWICAGILKIIMLFNSNPFTQALVLRLIASISSLLAIYFFNKNVPENRLPQWSKLILYFFSISIWYLPYIHSRFSSETAASIFMLLALGYYYKFEFEKKWIYALLTGVCWGLSFQFRYQTGIMIFFYAVWLVVYRFSDFKFHLLQGVGFIIIALLGVILDYTFYGELVFPSYNYFTTNIVDDVASTFGTSPWNFYYLMMMRRSFAPIAVLNLAALFYLALYKRDHLFFWLIVPFFIIHSFIPHKEIRFLFPLLFLAPYVITSLIHAIRAKYSLFLTRFNTTKILVALWLLMFPLLVWKSFYPASNYIKLVHHIYNTYSKATVAEVHTDSLILGLHPHFYFQNKITPKDKLCSVNLCDEFTPNNHPVLVLKLARDTFRCHHLKPAGIIKTHEDKPPLYDYLIKIPALKLDDYYELYEICLH